MRHLDGEEDFNGPTTLANALLTLEQPATQVIFNSKPQETAERRKKLGDLDSN